jgi:PPM family protein phosphatase
VFKETIAKWLARPAQALSFTGIPELAAWLGTTVGEVRPDNQDRAVVVRFTSVRRPRESFACFALCDGMGGMTDGARCAEIALSSFLFRLTHDVNETAVEKIRAAALDANDEVYREYREKGGTTLVAIVVFPSTAAAVSVGDSRIYSINKAKELIQISTDDTIAGELNKLTELKAARSSWATFAGQLTQFVGIGEGMEPRVYPIGTDLSYLLTSDGVHSMSPDTLNQIVSNGGSPRLAVFRLLQVSKWCGGTDNATAICVSPLRKDWSVSPHWANGDWFEVWDSNGKLELPVTPVSARAAEPSDPLKGDKETKNKRSRKRASGARKIESRSAGHDIHHRSAQRNLKIEIVDEKLREAASADDQSLNPAPKDPASADDSSGKRE